MSSSVPNDVINDILTMLMNIAYYIKNTAQNVWDVNSIDSNRIKNIEEKAQALTEKINTNLHSPWNLERMEIIKSCFNHILVLVDRRNVVHSQRSSVSKQSSY